MIQKCPKCHKDIYSSESLPITRQRYWTVSIHYFCSCGTIGELWIGHGKMYGEEKMIWKIKGEIQWQLQMISKK